MKTLKHFMVLLFFCLFLFSCEDEDPKITNPAVLEPGISIFGAFDLTTNSKLKEVNDHYVEFTYDLEGEGSLNLMEIASIHIYYEEFIEIRNDSSTIDRGQFIIKSNSGEEISGGLGGHLISNELSREERVNAYITDGTQQYKDSKGDFVFTFKKGINQKLMVDIQGKIYLNKDLQPQ